MYSSSNNTIKDNIPSYSNEINIDIDINAKYYLLQILSIILNKNEPIPIILYLLLINSPVLIQIIYLSYQHTYSENTDMSKLCPENERHLLEERLQNYMKDKKLVPILFIKEYLKCKFSNINSKYTEIKLQIEKLLFTGVNTNIIPASIFPAYLKVSAYSDPKTLIS